MDFSWTVLSVDYSDFLKIHLFGTTDCKGKVFLFTGDMFVCLWNYWEKKTKFCLSFGIWEKEEDQILLWIMFFKLRNVALAIEYTQISDLFTQMQTYTLKSKGQLYLKAVSLFVECRIQEAYWC